MTNTLGYRNVQFKVGSSEVAQLPGSDGEQPRYCSSMRLVRTLMWSATSTREDCQISCTCSVLENRVLAVSCVSGWPLE
jgi:hypothetical protein